jgi:hypothetical protein
METVFPPGWFNVIQYLLVHLPWEARVGEHVLGLEDMCSSSGCIAKKEN